MSDSVYELARNCRWKLKAILRTKRFNTSLRLINLYKVQLLSFIEYRTAAIYHACDTSLQSLDHVQDKLLEAAGMTAVEALDACNLAPLSARRDMALLGLIHRTVLGDGPGHLRSFFRLRPRGGGEQQGRHRLQLEEYTDGHWSDFVYLGSQPANYIRRSLLGLISVYNRLPAEIVESASSVSSFQSSLQGLLRYMASTGVADWAQMFSPRIPWHRHLLPRLTAAPAIVF